MRLLGSRGEEAAARHLKRTGYEIITRNWRSPAGEVDIIARQGETLVFVEVKARSGNRFGSAAESVDLRKQQRIIRTAMHYIGTLKHGPPLVRFDVICVGGGLRPQVEDHLEGAFVAES